VTDIICLYQLFDDFNWNKTFIYSLRVSKYILRLDFYLFNYILFYIKVIFSFFNQIHEFKHNSLVLKNTCLSEALNYLNDSFPYLSGFLFLVIEIIFIYDQ
jgi:hypothetical protein